jgi:hypothetical protein
MSMALAQFQDDFAAAVLAGDAISANPAIAALLNQPGFMVYRNTVMKGCIDALQANYPAVTRLVGEEWLRAAAAVFVRAHPPTQAALVHYGEGFADFLAGFDPAADMDWLPGVARLDRCWTEAHVARDAVPLAPARIAALLPEALASLHLRPHPAARWAWFAEAPVYTLWQRNRSDTPDMSDIAWQGEGALITRPQAAVQWTALDAAACAFMDACAAGLSLAEAAGAALAAQADTDLAGLMSHLLAAGAFAEQTVMTAYVPTDPKIQKEHP